jgi:hypothetical protein
VCLFVGKWLTADERFETMGINKHKSHHSALTFLDVVAQWYSAACFLGAIVSHISVRPLALVKSDAAFIQLSSPSHLHRQSLTLFFRRDSLFKRFKRPTLRLWISITDGLYSSRH